MTFNNDQYTHFLRECEGLFQDRFRNELVELAQSQSALLEVPLSAITAHTNLSVTDDLLEKPAEGLRALETLANEASLPPTVENDLGRVQIALTGLSQPRTHQPGELRAEHGGKYVAISGSLERVTVPKAMARALAFECQRCNAVMTVAQDIQKHGLDEPTECSDCERTGPFEPLADHPESSWSDYAKIRLAPRPDDTGSPTEGSLEGYAVDDVIDVGGESGLLGRAGEPMTAYGVAHQVRQQGRNVNDALFDTNFELRTVEFDRDRDTVDVAEHRETFERVAESSEAVDRFAASIVPELHRTDAWSVALEFAVAYLFGSPRIDVPGGPTYRGDLHGLIISDYGLGKSTFAEAIAEFSPKMLKKSTTALSSGVGLTAAAVKDVSDGPSWG